MADRVQWFNITVPANTLTAQTFPMVFPYGEVVEIDVKVPPGPAGNLGFIIMAGGSPYIPNAQGAFVFIEPDDDYLVFPVTHAITSGSFALLAFNTDVWPHSLQVGFQVNEIAPSPVSSFGQPIGL